MEKTIIAMIEAPFGVVLVMLNDQILHIELSNDIKTLNMPLNADSIAPETVANNPLMQSICAQISQYFQHSTTTFNFTYSPIGTPFQQRVWQAIKEIPVGQTQSYSDIAKKIGSGPRAVANACGANNLPLLIPCHRVVAKHGLGGFMQGKQNGLLIKKWLLQHEGIV